MSIRRRLTLHSTFAVCLAIIGYFLFSKSIFPVLLSSTNPVAPLVGMAAGLLFVGVPGIAGLGLSIGLEFVQGRKFQEINRTKIVDLIAGSQYLTAALILMTLHYFS